MKVFVAGIVTETNTFSPLPTGAANFAIAQSLEEEVGAGLGGTGEIARRCVAHGDELVFGLLAYAEPAGITVKAVYESLRDDILRQLSEHPDTDIVLLLLHGAMVAEGYDDCEADLTSRCRELAGPETVIGVELDLHAHVDERLLVGADIIKSYKEYPHVDIVDVALELYEACRDAAKGTTRPVMALADCRMVGLFSTMQSPVLEFVEELKAAESEDSVIAVSCIHGFPWGDVPHAGARLLVVTDNNPALAESLAMRLANRLFELRQAAQLPTVPMEEAMEQALVSTLRPVVVADQSDNPGGGAPSDSTFVLRWLLDRKVRKAGIAFIYDPEVVKTAIAAGTGARLNVRVGGKTSPASGDPVDLAVQVIAIKESYMHEFPQSSGKVVRVLSGDTVALESEGIYLIVNSSRCQCFAPSAFSDFGIEGLDIYIPKSTNHFLAGFGPVAGTVIMMAAPGAIVPLVKQIPFRRLCTQSMWPWTEQTRPRLLVPAKMPD